MHTYQITKKFFATFDVVVEAEDEGEAYTKAQKLAEESDMNQYIIGTELETICNCVE